MQANSKEITVDCEFYGQKIEHLGFKYQCKVLAPNIMIDDFVVQIKQKPSTPNTYKSVKLLSFTEGMIFETVPKGFSRFFVNLEAIQANDVKLRRLRRENLESFKDLRFLQIRNNQLEILESDLFAGNENLEFIDFSFNYLKFVGPTILDNMHNVKSINFLSNTILNVERLANTSLEIEMLKEFLKREFLEDIEHSIARREKVCQPLNTYIAEFEANCSKLINECESRPTENSIIEVDERISSEIDELKNEKIELLRNMESMKEFYDSQFIELNKNCTSSQAAFCRGETKVVISSNVQWFVISVLIVIFVALVGAVAFAIVKFIAKE